MRDTLERWIRDADVLRHLEHFSIPEVPRNVRALTERWDDLYLALAAQLFRQLRTRADSDEWASVANALGSSLPRSGNQYATVALQSLSDKSGVAESYTSPAAQAACCSRAG